MRKLQSFKIVATFFALWLAVFLEGALEEILAYVLILSLGLLHGANDIRLLQTQSDALQRKSVLFVILSYVLVVALGAAAFYLFPQGALLLFILGSGYHFGEEHWSNRTKDNGIALHLFYTLYGNLVLFLMFYGNAAQVQEIVYAITGYQLISAASFFGWTSIALFATSLLLCGLLWYQKKLVFRPLLEIFFLVVFFIVFHTATLIWAFGIYFILWHTLPSLMRQTSYLYGSYSKKSFLQYLKSSALYWVAAVVGLGVVYFLLKDEVKLFHAVFFAFTAAITFPHVIVMSRLKNS